MGNFKRTIAAREREIREMRNPKPECPACGERRAHFVPPMFGKAGFYMCAATPADHGLEKTDG